jgi:hypothetical protein
MAKGNRTTSTPRCATAAKAKKANGLTRADSVDLGAKLLANIRGRANDVNGFGYYVKNASHLLNLLADSMGADTTPLQHSEAWGAVYFLAHALDRVGAEIASEGESVASLSHDVRRVAL